LVHAERLTYLPISIKAVQRVAMLIKFAGTLWKAKKIVSWHLAPVAAGLVPKFSALLISLHTALARRNVSWVWKIKEPRASY
jgi:hypothetical protein